MKSSTAHPQQQTKNNKKKKKFETKMISRQRENNLCIYLCSPMKIDQFIIIICQLYKIYWTRILYARQPRIVTGNEQYVKCELIKQTEWMFIIWNAYLIGIRWNNRYKHFNFRKTNLRLSRPPLPLKVFPTQGPMLF